MNEATGAATWSSKGPTWEPSSASLSVSTAATIWPVSASMPRCSFRQDRRVLVPCFSISHSPAPHSFRPVLSTSRCMGSPSLRGRGRGTSSVSARRHRVVWSGTARSSPSRPMTEPISPSVCRNGRRKTARKVKRCQDRQGRVVGLPAPGRPWLGLPRLDGLIGEPHRQAPALAQGWRRTRASSLPCASAWGIWWRRSWFSLKGTLGIRGQVRGRPATPARPAAPPAGSMQQGR